MRSVFRLPMCATAATCAAVLLAGCGGGGGGGGGTTTNQTRNLVGQVFNTANGSPVAGATVTLGSRNATSDAGGFFRMEDFASDFTGGTLTVSANSFTTETAQVTVAGNQLRVSPIGLTPTGTPVAISPSAGGNVSQPVAEVLSMPPAALSVPAGALPGSASVNVSLTPVVNQPGDALVGSASVSAMAVGDVSSRGPEIEVRISPSGIVLNSPAPLTMPLPFALVPGSQIPVLQFKNGAWREIGLATVDPSGATATIGISEFLPTGVDAWHDFSYTASRQPGLALQEVTMASIQNDIRNLPDRRYVVNRVIESGRADITARFRWSFEAPTLPTTPVDEEILCLGTRAYRDIIGDYIASGEWNSNGGPVTFDLFQSNITVRRIIDGQFQNNAGTFSATWGHPSWPVPATHNQGGVQ